MKARLPEAGEIADAVGHPTWNEDTAISGFYLDSKSTGRTVGYGKGKATSDYDWLFNNLSWGSSSNDDSDSLTCLYYGCTQNLGKTLGDHGYWSSVSISGLSSQSWQVSASGYLGGYLVANTNVGIRPVISLNPNIFN